MTRSLLTGALYFAIVFAFAFAFGAVRVTWISPAVGALAATAVELPFTLGVAWVACGWLTRKAVMSAGQGLAVGAFAFALLMVCEASLAVLIFGQTPGQYGAGLLTPSGALGLAGQIAFGLIPAVRARLSAAF